MDNNHREIGAASLIGYVAAVAVFVSIAAVGIGFMVRVGWEAAGAFIR